MSRPAAASDAKRKPKRKVRRIIESSESEEDTEIRTEWNLRADTQHPLRFAITPETAAKWKEDESRVRARKEKKPPIAPMVINKDRSQEELLEIGETLVDEISVDAINLKTNFDIEAIDFEHISKAPGVAEQQMQQYASIAHIQKEKIEVPCYIPLLWFIEVMAELPFLPVVKQMYAAEAKELALNTSAQCFREIWKHVIIAYTLRKQDVADYLWHAQNSSSSSQKTEGGGTASKQQRVE